MKIISIAMIVSIALASHAAAQEFGDVKKGKTLALSVCAQCHAVRAGDTSSKNPMAPSFANVATWPGMTDRALRVWLQTSHRSMPNFMLTSSERSNVAAYIVSLKGGSSAM
jgi:mono/diheme cytochrome c family protein